MNIAIDCSKAINESAGIARYTEELTKNLITLYPEDKFFLYFTYIRNCKEKENKIKSTFAHYKNVKYKVYKLFGWMKERFFHYSVPFTTKWVEDSDVVHATEFLSFDNALKKPQVLTVHDLTMIKFPGHRGAESIRHGKMLKKACRNADMIIAISESTKDDIIKYFSVPQEKIKVIYNGKSDIFKPITDKNQSKYLFDKYNIDFPYFLFVGTIEPRKNIKNLLLAFDKYVEEDKLNHKLILVGRRGWNTDEIDRTFNEMVHKDKVVFLENVLTQDLPLFYNFAEFFCYPSLYEGFGLPILEAMACECPVITSKISSLPEVGENAVYYIDPNDYLSIYQAFKKLSADKKILSDFAKKGIIQSRKFSWEKCARQTHQVYEEILKNVK